MIQVIVVDDSPLVRKIATDILDNDPGISVIAVASSAEIAMRKIRKLKPDVITMDIEMPGMGGHAAISEIMKTMPTPIVVLSAFAKRGAELTLQALELGAADFIAKPTSSISGGITDISGDLIEKVKYASGIRVKKAVVKEDETGESKPRRSEEPSTRKKVKVTSDMFDVVAIGTSTGGPVALKTVLSRFPKNLPVGVVVVQHMPPVFTNAFAHRLDSLSEVSVKEAADGDLILPGRVLIAPGDFHMTVNNNNLKPKVHLRKGKPVSGHRPSIDVLIHSVAREYGNRAIGVIMTGMGKDGAEGLAELKENGGHVIAQDEETSAVFGMNREVIRNGHADTVVSVIQIADRVIDQLNVAQR